MRTLNKLDTEKCIPHNKGFFRKSLQLTLFSGADKVFLLRFRTRRKWHGWHFFSAQSWTSLTKMGILGHSTTIQYPYMIQKFQQISYSKFIVGHFMHFRFFRVYLLELNYFFLRCSISCLSCSIRSTCVLKQTATFFTLHCVLRPQ